MFRAAETVGSNGNRYRFTGKELGEETGLYDFSARFLQTSLGRFTTIDPLAEKYPNISPYAYCNGNPVNFVDPDGEREWPVNLNYNGFIRRNENNYRNPMPTHNGIDINFGSHSDDLGAPVYATHDGIVTRKRLYTDDNDSGGTRIQITSVGGEVSTFYMHLNTIEGFNEGDYVEEGTLIGTIGGSGRGIIGEHKPHLHYELQINGQYVNPSIDKDNLVDPQSLLTPINLGELEPAVIVEEKNKTLNKSFDVIVSVMYDVKI